MSLAPFKLERFFVPYEFKAQYLLGSSDCQSMTVGNLLALDPQAAEAFHNQWLGYTEYEGAPALRAGIATLYEHIAPEQVLVFSGAEEAIFAFMNTVIQPGDHLIVQFPGYQSLYEIAQARGCEISFWTLSEETQWSLDLNWLQEQIRPNTRAVVINSPHNPTGMLIDQTTQTALISLLRERGIYLFSDEVYRGLEHDPQTRTPAACDVYERAVSLGVMSKTYGLAGLRIGWIATRDREVFAQMAQFKDYTTICNSAPSEFLSVVALKHRETIVARNLAIIHQNLALLDDFFARYSGLFRWIRPQAGSTAFPRILFDEDIETFCIDLVESQGVMLLPGTCFFYGDKHFRVGYGRTNMPEALAQFEVYLQRRGLI